MPWSIRMLLMFTLASMLFQYYVSRKAIVSIEAVTGWKRKRIKVGAIAVIIWVILYPLLILGSYYLRLPGLSRALQGSNMLLDLLITYPFWLGVILAVQLAILFLLLDITKLVLYPVFRKHRERWNRIQAWVVVILVCAGAVYVAARVYNDTFTVRTREAELRVASLPPELEGFRIVQIADLQADGRTGNGKLQPFIDRVNALNPDLILFGGDLVTSGIDYIDAGAEAIGEMQARHGIYACLGDHDFFSNQQRVKESLERNGVTVLANVAAIVPVGSSLISIVGVTNVYRAPANDYTLDAIEKQRVSGPVNIFLTHQPSISMVDYAAKRGFELFVAGHTHGGQIVFPLPGFLLTGSSFETDYVSGFYRVGSMLVSVNNGLGLTLAPVRYHAPAEVTLIVLRREA
ncbi:MAG TPA: metallophosphoesterase [Blastocatellia bacterium]|nr:metallophosphoesterase [Blastocatellia bacterium]